MPVAMPRGKGDAFSAMEVVLPSPPRTRLAGRRAHQEHSVESEYIDIQLPPQRTLRGLPQRLEAPKPEARTKAKRQASSRSAKPPSTAKAVALRPDPALSKPLKVIRSPKKRAVSVVEEEGEPGDESSTSTDEPTRGKRPAHEPLVRPGFYLHCFLPESKASFSQSLPPRRQRWQ